jgi:hypothetical protein
MEAMIPMLYLFYYELVSSRRGDINWGKGRPPRQWPPEGQRSVIHLPVTIFDWGM